jgi:hypothetical protein
MYSHNPYLRNFKLNGDVFKLTFLLQLFVDLLALSAIPGASIRTSFLSFSFTVSLSYSVSLSLSLSLSLSPYKTEYASQMHALLLQWKWKKLGILLAKEIFRRRVIRVPENWFS